MTSRALLLSAVLAAGARADVFLFGPHDGVWSVVDSSGKILERHTRIGGISPSDATISRDGKRWAAVEPGPYPTLLTLSSADGSRVRAVQSKGNVLDGVAFSPDGEWVYYSANDDAQPRFDNQSMRYAQIYRSHFSRNVTERLTMERGCHMWPRVVDSGFVNSHSTCYGGRSLEARQAGRVTTYVPNSETVGESASRSGAVFYFQVHPSGGSYLRVSDGKTTETWGETRLSTVRARPQWADSNTVLFQNDGRLWSVRKNELLQLAVFIGGNQ